WELTVILQFVLVWPFMFLYVALGQLYPPAHRTTELKCGRIAEFRSYGWADTTGTAIVVLSRPLGGLLEIEHGSAFFSDFKYRDADLSVSSPADAPCSVEVIADGKEI